MEAELGERDTRNYSEAPQGWDGAHGHSDSKVKCFFPRRESLKGTSAVSRGWARTLQARDPMDPANKKAQPQGGKETHPGPMGEGPASPGF